ncbi:MAG: phosphate/phosphite/phosphonate ABC transporter substrate-binding protein [Nitrospirae bacterium]|nr:phosphate/phosphite/phosphonate ABC transporter substrate-binding protein [Nitrospirota bacterium]
MFTKYKLVIVLIITAALFSCQKTSTDRGPEKVIKVGFMICNSEEETLYRFRPLTAFLGKKLGVKMEAAAIDTIQFTKEVEHLDFTHTNSLLYIILNRFHGVKVLTADAQGPLGFKSTGAIVTTKDSDIKTIKDLKGRSMIFGPMLGPTGYLQQYDLMLRDGINPEDDLSFYTIPTGTYKHEKVIYSVLYGKFDAGAFQMLDFEKMIEDGKIVPEDFRIIAEGDPIPYCTFGYTQKVEDQFAERFKKALLELKESDTVEIDGETVSILKRARLDGFAGVKDEDYNIVRDIAKRTNMPPYQKY